MVDMVTSKNSPYGRVLVTVLDSKAIPEQLGVVIGDRWFEFPIEVDSIIHGVESYVEISNDPGERTITMMMKMMIYWEMMICWVGEIPRTGSIMQVRAPKTILMLIWTHITMRSSQVTKPLVSNKKTYGT